MRRMNKSERVAVRVKAHAARGQAKAAGHIRYIGRQCPEPGHGSVRYVTSDYCIDCIAARDTVRSRRKAEFARKKAATMSSQR